MASVFKLFGELRADTTQFDAALRRSDSQLAATRGEIEATEKRAVSLGKTSATTARAFERLSQTIGEQKQKMTDAVNSYNRGEISSKQLAKALSSVDSAAAGVSSKIADTNARLTDFSRRASQLPSQLRNLGAGLTSVGMSLTAGLTAPLLAAGYAFVNSATSIDAMRNKLTAATGSVDAANKKLRELRSLAQGSAGVFTAGAVEMYAFMRPMKLSEGVIENMIKAMGRLKLANEDIDLQKTSLNLTQLFSQGFERTDLKELVGQFPRFGEILQQAFKLSDSDIGTIGAEMKDKLAAGLSKEDFFAAIANALNNDSALSKLSDTIGIRFQKMMERMFVAVEPLGNAILGILEPVMAAVTPIIEQLSAAFAGLSPTIQGVIAVFVGVAAALGPVMIAVGAVVSAIGTIAGAIPALGGLGAIAPIIAVIVAGLAQIALAAGAIYAAWQTNFGGIRDLVQSVGSEISTQWQLAMTELTALTATATAEIQQFWAANGQDIIKALKKTSDALKTGWQAIAAFWRDNGENLTAIATAMWGSIKTVIIAALKIIGAAIKTIAAVINGDWAKAWDGLLDIGRAVLSAMLSLIKGFGSLLAGAVKAAFGAVAALSGWVMGEATRLGVAVIQGIVNGVTSGTGRAIAAVREVAAGIIGAAKGVLGIQSPSKVFFAIGKDVAQGFIDGIAAMKASTQAAMSSVLDVSGLKLGKPDAAGVEMLTGLANEIARFNAVGNEQNTILDLTAGKYGKLNAEVRNRILLAARELDSMELLRDGLGKVDELMGEFIAEFAPEKTNVEKLTAALGDKGLQAALASLDPFLANAIQKMAMFNAQMADAASVVEGIGMPNRSSTGPMLGDDAAVDVFGVDSEIPPPPLAPWENFWATMAQRLEAFKQSLPSLKQALGENLVASIENIGSVFGNAIAQWDGTAKGFFKSLAQGFRQMVSQIVAELVRLLVIKAIMQVVGGLAGGFGGSGGADAGGFIPVVGRAEGGPVYGRGTSTSDSILARLSNGEFVMKAKAVKQWGVGFFDQLNNGLQMPQMAFAGGGYVGGMSSSMVTNNTTSNQPINVYVQGGGTREQNQLTGYQIATALQQKMEHNNRRNK